MLEDDPRWALIGAENDDPRWALIVEANKCWPEINPASSSGSGEHVALQAGCSGPGSASRAPCGTRLAGVGALEGVSDVPPFVAPRLSYTFVRRLSLRNLQALEGHLSQMGVFSMRVLGSLRDSEFENICDVIGNNFGACMELSFRA